MDFKRQQKESIWLNRLRFLAALAALHLSVPFALTEDWSSESGKEHRPAEQENRIIKWCSEDGSRVRYASANLTIKGFQPCGTLAATKTCDAVGNRIISKDGARPRDHRDCDLGPRILVIRQAPEDEIDLSGLDAKRKQGEPLTPEEQRSLEKELKIAEKKQAAYDPAKQVEDILRVMLSGYMSGGQPLSQEDARAKKQLKAELERTDPGTRKLLENFLNVNYWKKVLGTP